VKRFLIFWLVLGIVQLLVGGGISLFLFRFLDLGFEFFAQLFLVPAFQALLLCAALPDTPLVSRRTAWMAAWGEPWIAVFLIVDMLVIVLAWGLRGHPWFLPRSLAAIQAFAAGLLLVALARGRRFSSRERAWLLAAGVGVLAYSLDFIFGWIAAFPDVILAGKGRLVRWLCFYPALFSMAIFFLFKVEEIFRRRWPAPAQVLDAAPAFAVAGATIVVLNIYWRPYLVEPWASLARTGSFLTVACLFASLLLLLRSEPSGTSEESSR